MGNVGRFLKNCASTSTFLYPLSLSRRILYRDNAIVLSTRIAGGAGEGFSQVKAGYGITFLVLSVPSGEASLPLMARSTNMTATGAYPKMFLWEQVGATPPKTGKDIFLNSDRYRISPRQHKIHLFDHFSEAAEVRFADSPTTCPCCCQESR